jgi:hypothetical protein
MIFGDKKSAVKNHLSTKRSLSAHKHFVDKANDSVTKPLRDEEHSNDISPPPRLEEPEVAQSQS